MTRFRVPSVVLALTLMTSCAPRSAPAFEQALAVTPVAADAACDASSCEAMWQRAQVWLGRHSVMRIQSATVAVLSTYSPGRLNPVYGFQITKEPTPNGGGRVTVEMACGSAGTLTHCEPSEASVRRAFLHYLRTGEDVLALRPTLAGVNSVR